MGYNARIVMSGRVAGALVNATDYELFILPFKAKLDSIRWVVSDGAVDNTHTVRFFKHASADGTETYMTAATAANVTANATQTATISATAAQRVFAAGDRFGFEAAVGAGDAADDLVATAVFIQKAN